MTRLAMILGMFTLLLVSMSNAQQRWERNYGGTGEDNGFSVQQTQDGGYVVAGYTNSFGNGVQVFLVKTNASGDALWTRNFGGANSDYGHSVQQTSDLGYIVAGYTNSFGNGVQVYLLKINSFGDTLLTRTYGGANSEGGNSVQQTSDTGYIVAGWTGSFGNGGQVYLIKTNAYGDTLWTRTYGGTNDDYGTSVQQTSDGGYIVAGSTSSFGDSDQVYLVKTNASGDTLWTRNYGGTNTECGYSVQQTSDGGYIVAGYTTSFGNDFQVYLIKTNALGDTLWTKTYGGTRNDRGYSVQQTSDGGYIVAGVYDYSGPNHQVYLIKTNASGDTLWTKTHGGTGSEEGESVQQTQDGGYIIAGWTLSFGNGIQVYLIKTDANGNVGVETPVRQLDGSTVRQLKATPNPFNSFATLPGHEAERFSLYDVSGRKVGVFKGDRVGEGLAPGVYFIKQEDRDSKPLRIVKVR